MFQFKQARRFLAIIAVHLSILPPASEAADNLGILALIPGGTCWKNIRKQLPTMSSPD